MTCQEMILSEDYIELIGKDVLPEVWLQTAGKEYCTIQVDNYINILYAQKQKMPAVSMENYPYLSIPRCYGLMQEGGMMSARSFDPLSLDAAGILSVQRPPLSLTGKGVICGFLDTGIRYQENVFRRSDGSSRILTIWDQTVQSGTPPEGFLYGSEYNTEDINRALETGNPYAIVPTTDNNGHGSNIVSVAAGTTIPTGRIFTGAAPDADIAVVKLKETKIYLRQYYGIPSDSPCYSETDILLAIQYLQGLAIRFRKPVVICIALGTSYGDHNGQSPLAQYCGRIAQNINRAVLISTGNEGNRSHHTQGFVGQERKEVEIRVGENVEAFVAEIWVQLPYVLTMSLRSPAGEVFPPADIRLGNQYVHQFVYEETVLTINSEQVELASGEQLIRLHFEKPTAGIWTLFFKRKGNEGEAVYNIWLPISDFLTDYVYFLAPTPYTTLTEPSASRNSLTVTAYQDNNRSIYPAAGRGYTSSGMIKPDIAAPGVMVSTVSGQISGTGVATALTCGAAAQYMQWAAVEQNESNANTQTLKNFFIRGAIQDVGIEVPSREIGWGFLDIQNSFRQYIS